LQAWEGDRTFTVRVACELQAGIIPFFFLFFFVFFFLAHLILLRRDAARTG